MLGQVWVPLACARLVPEPSGAPGGVVGVLCVVLAALDDDAVDDVAAFAIAAPPAASEPVTTSAAIEVAIRCRIGSHPFFEGPRVNSLRVGGL
jgi:hypothetical protein